jgi:hypothetical protein
VYRDSTNRFITIRISPAGSSTVGDYQQQQETSEMNYAAKRSKRKRTNLCVEDRECKTVRDKQ